MVNIKRIPKFLLLSNEKWREFVCIEEGEIEVTLSSGKVVDLFFKEGWTTDVTTTPRILQSFLPQLGPHAPASVSHDLALEMCGSGEITLKESREVGFKVLEYLEDVDFISYWSWKFGVFVKDFFR